MIIENAANLGNDDFIFAEAPPQGPVVTIEPVGSVLEGDEGTTPVTITLNRTSDNEDDLAPLVSLDAGPVAADEGDRGVTPFTFTVTRSGDTSVESTVP